MKKKIYKITLITIVTALLSVGSYVVTHGDCPAQDNAECYSFENGKSCLPLSEPGAGNCKRDTEVPAD